MARAAQPRAHRQEPAWAGHPRALQNLRTSSRASGRTGDIDDLSRSRAPAPPSPPWRSPFAAQAQNISIATGGTGGVYYPMGGGIAAVLSKYVPGMQATAEVTGGSVDNLKLIGSGKPYIALRDDRRGQDAFRGEDKFKGNKVPLRTLMVLYPNRMHVVTVEGRGITKMADLKGKRVSTGSPGSATEVMAFRVIEAAGLDKDKRHEARAPRRGRVGQRDQGRQDRRLLLGRRPADRGGHRPRPTRPAPRSS